MAWQRNQQPAAEEKQAAPQQTQTGELKLAGIAKSTREAMDDNPYVKDAAFKLYAIAKELGKALHDYGFQPKDKDKSGQVYTTFPMVKVEPIVAYNKETAENEMKFHEDGSPVYAPRIELRNQGQLISLYAKEDMSEGARLTAATVKTFDRDLGHTVIVKMDDVQASPSIYKGTKLIAEFIDKQGYIQGKEAPQRSEMQSFAYEANMYFKDNSPKVTNKDGKEVMDSYAQYDADFDRVSLRSHSVPNTSVELNIGAKGGRFAELVEFDANNQPHKTPIKNPDELAAMIDAGRVTPEIGIAIEEFKQGPERSQLYSLAVELNKRFKDESDIIMKDDGTSVQNSYAEYNEEYDSIRLRNHDCPIVVELSMYQDKPVVRAIDFSERGEDGKFPQVFINNQKDIDEYLGAVPKEIQEAALEFKASGHEKAAKKAKNDVERD